MEPTVSDVFLELFRSPREVLVRHWNWKAALISSGIRATIFFSSNLSHGWRAAGSVLLTEFLFRPLVSGFLGSLTQAFRFAQPLWAANLIAMLLFPAIGHVIEYGVHRLDGTPNLSGSISWSMAFSVFSALFNLYAMRRGVLVVNASDEAPIGNDLKRLPLIFLSFLAAGPLAIYRAVRRQPVKSR